MSQAPTATPQVVVAGAPQGVIVPQPGGPQAVQTVVIILVTATPPPPVALTQRPAGPAPTAAPTFTPGPPPPTPPPTATALPPVTIKVKSDQANVRQGPGETYPLITRLDRETVVTVVARNRAGTWWKICCVNGGDVWIADSLVTVEGPDLAGRGGGKRPATTTGNTHCGAAAHAGSHADLRLDVPPAIWRPGI